MATASAQCLTPPNRRVPVMDSSHAVVTRFLAGAAAIDANSNGLIAASLVELASGRTLAAARCPPDCDIVAAGAAHGAVLRHKLRLVRALCPGAHVDDVLLLSTNQIHMLRLLSPGLFVYVIVDATLTHLAAVRAAVTRYMGDLA
jgi:hypothetical protein